MSEFSKFRVSDLIQINSRWTFILESPHHTELENGYPAAGEAGVIMSEELLGRSEPLGFLVKTQHQDAIGISIMNASCIPLQRQCYKEVAIPADLKSIFNARNTTSKSIPETKRTFKAALDSDFGRRISNNFRERMRRHVEHSKQSKFVVCGVIAQSLFEVVTESEGWFHESRTLCINNHAIPVFYENHPSQKSGPSHSQWQEPQHMCLLHQFLQ